MSSGHALQNVISGALIEVQILQDVAFQLTTTFKFIFLQRKVLFSPLTRTYYVFVIEMNVDRRQGCVV